MVTDNNIKANHRWKAAPRFLREFDPAWSLVALCFLIGIVSGIIASGFRYFLLFAEQNRQSMYNSINVEDPASFFLLIGCSCASLYASLFLIQRFSPECSGSGVHEIEGGLDGLRKIDWKRVLPVKFLSSGLSLGSGLLLGREGPTIQLGANIGKMVNDLFKQAKKDTNTLVSAGAAAGLAAAFNAPFSGIIFIIEEMHGHFKHTIHAVIGTMVASASSD